jgi:hypothetical protein
MTYSPFGAFPGVVDENIREAGGIESLEGSEYATNFILQQFFQKCATEAPDVSTSVGMMVRLLSRSIAHIAVNLKENGMGRDIDEIVDKLLDVLDQSMEISIEELEHATQIKTIIRKQ